MKNNSRILSGFSLLLGLQACNALIGIDDVTLGSDTSTGATSSNGGEGASTSGGTDSGGAQSSAGTHTVAGSSADAGGGGVDTGGSAGSGGNAGEGATGTVGGEGGMPSAGGEAGEAGSGNEGGVLETAECPAVGEDYGGGELELVQFAPHDGGRGRLSITQDGKNAYVTSWGAITQHFARSTTTGKLTPKSKAGIYNGEFTALSADDKHLYAGGVNGIQYYDIPIANDGSIADTATPVPPGYVSSLDAVRVGGTIFLASNGSIRSIVNGVYSTANRFPGTYDFVQTLTRAGDYLYWTEYSRGDLTPDKVAKVGRGKLHCDGTVGAREAFTVGLSPTGVAACATNKNHYLYVIHRAAHLPEFPGWIDVVDLSKCATDFSTCAVAKKITSSELSGVGDLAGVNMAPDCSTLYVSSFHDAKGHLMVLSLADPLEPSLLQTFEEGGTYDGIETTGGFWAWHMSWFDGYLYIPSEFGKGVYVFRPKAK